MEARDVILNEIIRVADEGGTAVLATIVRVRGSTPRSVGASMVVHASGSTVGTIGGGCGEADVLAAAARVLSSGAATLVRVELTDDVESLSPAVCGGVMDVLVEPLAPASDGGSR